MPWSASIAEHVLVDPVWHSDSLEAAFLVKPYGLQRTWRCTSFLQASHDDVITDLSTTSDGSIRGKPVGPCRATLQTRLPGLCAANSSLDHLPSGKFSGRWRYTAFLMSDPVSVPRDVCSPSSPCQARASRLHHRTSFDESSDMDTAEVNEKNRLEKSAGIQGKDPDDMTLCPEGKANCISMCKTKNRGAKHWAVEKGCVRRCYDYCTDDESGNGCPDGRKKCDEYCEEGLKGSHNTSVRSACKERCRKGCCPLGVETCKNECDTKPPYAIRLCRVGCMQNCGRVAGQAAPDNLCPETRAKCVHDCGNKNPGDANFTTMAGCAVRCLDSCTDPSDTSDIDKCPESRLLCEQHCKDVVGGDDEKMSACKARCVDSCCPQGREQCRAACSGPYKDTCQRLCDINCPADHVAEA